MCNHNFNEHRPAVDGGDCGHTKSAIEVGKVRDWDGDDEEGQIGREVARQGRGLAVSLLEKVAEEQEAHGERRHQDGGHLGKVRVNRNEAMDSSSLLNFAFV